MNKQLDSVSNDHVSLEVYECGDCGFHIGLDSSFIEQIGDIKIKCPACENMFDTGSFKV